MSRGGVFSLNGIAPKIADDVFLAPGSIVAGDVEIGPGSSVWFNAVIRGDVAPIRVGARTNIQDGAILHIDSDAPCIVGDDVTVGHGAIVHGTTVGNRVTIGMGAIVLSRSQIGDDAIIAAGALVAEDAVIGPLELVMGIPGRVRRTVEPGESARMRRGTESYVANAKRFAAGLVAIEDSSGETDAR